MNKVIAIIWDYDGTLVDTRFKNLNINRQIVEAITGKKYTEFPSLRSVNNYDLVQKKMTNWQDLYKDNYGFSEEEVIRAGQLWGRISPKDSTETPLYFGIEETISKLAHFKQGVFSQNSKNQIEKSLVGFNLQGYFSEIIGFEQLAHDEQKPSPAGLVKIVELLTSEKVGTVLFVGDHVTDFRCAVNTNQFYLEKGINIEVKSVGVNYSPDSHKDSWDVQPDFIANKANDLVQIASKFGG